MVHQHPDITHSEVNHGQESLILLMLKLSGTKQLQNSGLDTRPQITPCTMALIAKALRVVVFLPDKLIMTSTLHTNRNMLKITSSGGRPHC